MCHHAHDVVVVEIDVWFKSEELVSAQRVDEHLLRQAHPLLIVIPVWQRQAVFVGSSLEASKSEALMFLR